MKEFTRAALIFITMTIMLGLIYPFAMTGISKLFLAQKADGSPIIVNNKLIGSHLIGQNFTNPKYFHGRPSALDKPYDAGNSGGSNFGPSNEKFLLELQKRINSLRIENLLDTAAPVPADLVLASSSGLDPHITVEAAMLQVPRVARVRELQESEIAGLVQRHIEKPILIFLGEPRINVLEINLSLDNLDQSKN